jgi:hypothetical protein
MHSLFEVPWLGPGRRTLLGFAAVVILVFSLCALLKINMIWKQAPAEELHTGSIQRSYAIRRSPSKDPPSKDPMAAFLVHAVTVQTTVKDAGSVPLPRARPKGL